MKRIKVQWFDVDQKKWRTRDLKTMEAALRFVRGKKCLVKLILEMPYKTEFGIAYRTEEIYNGPARKLTPTEIK